MLIDNRNKGFLIPNILPSFAKTNESGEVIEKYNETKKIWESELDYRKVGLVAFNIFTLIACFAVASGMTPMIVSMFVCESIIPPLLVMSVLAGLTLSLVVTSVAISDKLASKITPPGSDFPYCSLKHWILEGS